MKRDRDAERRREAREREALQEAKREQRAITYTDEDGCDVTATDHGYIFYNVADWYWR